MKILLDIGNAKALVKGKIISLFWMRTEQQKQMLLLDYRPDCIIFDRII